MKLDAATTQRFENALPLGPASLKQLAMTLASEGMSQSAICHAFDSFGDYLNNAGRDYFEQVMIWVSIEYIVGWKSRDSWWFDHPLSMDEINEYGKTVSAASGISFLSWRGQQWPQ